MKSTPIGERRDLVGGAILAGIGLFIGIYAFSHYELGTLNRMGPGMVPTMLGGILTIFGVVIVGLSLRRADKAIEVDFRSLTAISLAAVLFALVLEMFGLFPAAVASSLAATMFEKRLTWWGWLILALVLAGITVLIFPMALGMRISVARWPL